MRYEGKRCEREQRSDREWSTMKEVLAVKEERTIKQKRLPDVMPDIEKFVGIKAKVAIQKTEQEIDYWHHGCRACHAVIKGVFHVMALYAANEVTKSVHMLDFDVEFNDSVPLINCVEGELVAEIEIEEIKIKKLDSRAGEVSIIWGITVFGNSCAC